MSGAFALRSWERASLTDALDSVLSSGGMPVSAPTRLRGRLSRIHYEVRNCPGYPQLGDLDIEVLIWALEEAWKRLPAGEPGASLGAYRGNLAEVYRRLVREGRSRGLEVGDGQRVP